MNRKEWRELTGGAGFSLARYCNLDEVQDWLSTIDETNGGIVIFAPKILVGNCCATNLTCWQEKQLESL